MALDIEPATTRLAVLVRRVPDGMLGDMTPCDRSVGELLDHIQSFAAAFRAAADKDEDATTAGPPPTPDVSRLGDDWRDRIEQLLRRLANSWKQPLAWEGTTRVGGLDMPGEAAGIVALDEVILHSWDLAVATGQEYEPPADLVGRLMPFLQHMAEPAMTGAREGLFGPVVPVDRTASQFDQVLGLAGRRPGWRPT